MFLPLYAMPLYGNIIMAGEWMSFISECSNMLGNSAQYYHYHDSFPEYYLDSETITIVRDHNQISRV